MKKLMFAIGLGLLSGSLYAACMGPYCYDDTGASIGGLSFDGNGNTVPNASSTTIAGITPKAVGQMIMCTSCTGNNASGGKVLCVSTAAVVGSFTIVSSTSPICK